MRGKFEVSRLDGSTDSGGAKFDILLSVSKSKTKNPFHFIFLNALRSNLNGEVLLADIRVLASSMQRRKVTLLELLLNVKLAELFTS